MGMVVAEVAVDDFGELALEAAQGFGGGLVLGLFALVVGAAGSGVHGLDAGGQVQGVVEGSVAGAGESVAALVAAGDLDRGGAGVAGVVVGVGEAGDVAGVAEDLGGQDVADAEDLGERQIRACGRIFPADGLVLRLVPA